MPEVTCDVQVPSRDVKVDNNPHNRYGVRPTQSLRHAKSEYMSKAWHCWQFNSTNLLQDVLPNGAEE